ncbi:beta-N-acetylhexosaminidase [Gleimia hominis]|uniref:beta-N-acetylhexosaminidase n=1 Tax=Gleimia hominis TaxID=595468 RepID=UPI000C8054B4|nr:beta-N-acetylhexosaminidase [Gleimia hominis]WIK64720.1 beta-N-acetylhexosaminidase [Gleimia hominis]
MLLIPTPKEVHWQSGQLTLPDPVVITGDVKAVRTLKRHLRKAGGLTVQDGLGGTISFERDETLAGEQYRLVVNEHQVKLFFGTEQGAARAVQTLLQLMPVQIYGPGPMQEVTVARVEIKDEPKYAWRGAHSDVARHFLPFEGLLKYLDVMAMHKLNVLHLHLTDDQGWRIPIPKYPELTRTGAWRPGTVRGHQPPPDENDCDDYAAHDGIPHGGYYTTEQLMRLNEHADELGITIMPEIDMPGHMESAIAAYPHLGCDHVQHPRTCFGISGHVLKLNETTVQFCKDVLDHVMSVFPSSPIHIGGDECPGDEWLTDPSSQETMRKAGAQNTHEAQAWFEEQITEHLIERGRQVVAWDEVLEGGAPKEVTVMVWRDKKAITEAVNAGHDVIAAIAEYTYLDNSQYEGPNEPLSIGGPVTFEKVAKYHEAIVPQGETNLAATASTETTTAENKAARGRVLGGQFQVWAEYIRTWPRAQYSAWPRGCSVAQQLWTGGSEHVESVDQLMPHLARLTAAEINWCRPPAQVK